jgi:hypothetical protein
MGNRDDLHLTSKLALTGTWKLVSVTSTNTKGEVIENTYGLNPKGFLTCRADCPPGIPSLLATGNPRG